MKTAFRSRLLAALALAGCAAKATVDGQDHRFLFTDPEAGIVAEPLSMGPTVIGASGEPVTAARWTGRSAPRARSRLHTR